MEFYKRFIEIVDANLIYCLIPIILTLILVELVFKNRFETKKALNLVRWTIIIYAIITGTITILGIAIYLDDSTFVNRATGPYKIAYWTMFLSSLILPFTLLVKKLATKFWYVLFVAFCMKIGNYFERFVIITTSLHRDYLPDNGNTEFADSIMYIIGMILMQGMLIAILTLGVFEMTKKKKNCA
ncbi:MAG: hypothetical protein ACKVQV_09545 [Bacteroidia bacterium]